jgi:hypothetical protein
LKQIKNITVNKGYVVAQLVEALRYKPEGRDSIPDGLSEIF